MSELFLRQTIERNIPEPDEDDFDSYEDYESAIIERENQVQTAFEEAIEQSIDERLGK